MGTINSRKNPGAGEGISIAVLGMGHVGLPTALGLAEIGWRVVGADSDSSKISTIQTGQCPFFEAGIQQLLAKHLAGGNLKVTQDVEGAIREASVLFICVGTPQKDDGAADLSQVELLARTIARNLNGYKLIVEKSTVPAITGKWIKKTVSRFANAGGLRRAVPAVGSSRGSTYAIADLRTAKFEVACNPEFLQEGRAVENVLHPARVICGVESDRAQRILAAVYRPLKCPLVITDLTTAEIIKHAANSFLAAKISFINMVADLCEKVGADVTSVAQGIGLDPRIGSAFLQAGIGFGGYCFPKDLRAFIHLAEEQGVDFSLLKEVERINHRRVELLVSKIREALWVLRGKTVALLGLAFKPDTDDVREAPSLRIARSLKDEGVNLRLYDPQAIPNMRKLLPEEPGRIVYCRSAGEAAADAHALVLLTEWEEFRRLDLPALRHRMALPILIDGRNIFDPRDAQGAGFEYYSIGRAKQTRDAPTHVARALSFLKPFTAPSSRKWTTIPQTTGQGRGH